jgi:hypothetical protein
LLYYPRPQTSDDCVKRGITLTAACAAAILQHFEDRGIEIFADYRYDPNQLVYHKIFDALKNYKV